MSRRTLAARYRTTLDAAEVRRQQSRAEAAVLQAIAQRLAELHQLADLLAFVRAVPITDNTAPTEGGVSDHE